MYRDSNHCVFKLGVYVSHYSPYLPSLFARQWVKDVFSVVFKMPPCLYRQFYFIQSSFFVFLLCYCWTPQPTVVWDVQFAPIRYTLYGTYYSCVSVTPSSGVWSNFPSIFRCRYSWCCVDCCGICVTSSSRLFWYGGAVAATHWQKVFCVKNE